MSIIKAIFAWIAMTVAGMWGGQRDKPVRRFGIPAIAIGFGASMGWNWRYLGFLALIPILSMGYGENSQLGALVGYNEAIIRLIYALLLSTPFYLFGWRRGLVAGALLVCAFQVRAGTMFHIGTYDVLIEDICRFSTLSALIIANILFGYKK
jgi:hypothetical protein